MYFAYITILQSRKQVAVRHETSVPGNITKAFLQNMAVGPTRRFITKFIVKKSAPPRHTVALPVPLPAPAYPRLDMHEYFIKFWLPHCSKINVDDPHYPMFRKLCLSPDPELFPYLESCTVDVGLYQQLIQYAVLERHPPLLRVVRDHLVKQAPHMVSRIFKDCCPGTSVSFLHVAATLGHDDIIAELRNVCAINGADADGKTPLTWAAEKGHEAVVKLLVENGADLEAKDKKHGRTPLLWAAEKGHEAVVKLLLEKGVELEPKDNFGRTPLSWAAGNGHEAVVKLLLEKGVELESKDNFGQTPLSWAAGNGHEAVVKLLVEKGANIESKDKEYGRTPLLWAAENGHEGVVRLIRSKIPKRPS
ncbi:hypothetical protein H2198_003328 [Neophaeococcomyces mojaviensis]|uniref:Uncharacterized protein n=1 Tax=Neophaeococcomyces mojaviensis TaxID=3383035 RepID=A0ACC3ACE9_9EURO|nr:hypothetical protein H2198_003328 [Knufia sp. JES_112]